MVIYKITNIRNNKVYIGQTSVKHNQRWTNHKYSLRKNIHSNNHLQAAWNKYGEVNFHYEIIYTAVSKEDLNNKEKEFIKKLKSNDPSKGYNLDQGGGVGRMTEENKEKLRERMLGNKNTLGRKKTEEEKEAHRQMMIGRKLRPRTEEEKAHLSALWSGDKCHWHGKPAPNVRKVLCHNNGKVYDSVHLAALDLKCDRSSISKVCRGKQKSIKGYTFEYID